MQISALTSGLNTWKSAQQRVDSAASNIASAGVPQSVASTASETDLVEQFVQLERGKLEAQAGAKLIKTSDEVLGTLLDTRA
ncbi:hypothetical protein D3880_02175 [Pseudomonas cavernae]|uniref:Pyrroloquinoline quinone biosynthesis protein PqqE n=1 Tax=Pseudomonas cavernae TaxID=2320867 RepID=A0A385YZ68_9PSED|nr:hypothetical protein [Pseudomonas cavernae]AYC31267.1 hypothetical protein D3880_02175 [Pseudomonas cavernae]